MKKQILSVIAIVAAFVVCTLGTTAFKTAASLDTTEPSDPLHGIVYYKNPVSGKLALYVSYELEPEHEYSFQITDDGVTFSEIFHKSMKGVTHEIYESFNVPDPCNGLWPRVLDVTPH